MRIDWDLARADDVADIDAFMADLSQSDHGLPFVVVLMALDQAGADVRATVLDHLRVIAADARNNGGSR